MSTLTYDPTVQRLRALERANDVRTRRARLKRDIGACRVTAASVLAESPDWVASMWVVDLLLAAPRCGKAKAHAAMRRAGVSPRVTVGELSDRQRMVLAAALERRPEH